MPDARKPGETMSESDKVSGEVTFLSAREREIADTFMSAGCVVVEVEDRSLLDRIRDHIANLAADHLGADIGDDPGAFLNSIHERVTIEGLNDLRLAVIQGLRAADWFRPSYFQLVRSSLADLVGNELAMQRGVGLSVQLPQDVSSLLPVHDDVWDGDSEFEVVVWLPLVDCYDTKSMYLLAPNKDRPTQDRMGDFRNGSAEDLYAAIQDDVEFMNVPFGTALIFSQTLMHGNRINETAETRWSMNCRFKSLLSPYADKKLGEFFEPITLKPTTRLAMEYELPGDFDE